MDKGIISLKSVVTGLFLALALQFASADTVTFLTVGNSGLSTYPGPYASVSVNLAEDFHSATITFSYGAHFVAPAGARVGSNSVGWLSRTNGRSAAVATGQITALDRDTLACVEIAGEGGPVGLRQGRQRVPTASATTPSGARWRGRRDKRCR